MTESADVVIVGGGPTGLWLASELVLAGVNPVVLERRQEPMEQSRALTLHGRTIETFALRGVESGLISQGSIIPKGHFALLETPVEFNVIESEYPHALFVSQQLTEAFLEANARSLGVDIRRGYTVDTLSRNGDLAMIEGQSPDDRFNMTARFVVGADGARSFVRQAAGISFPGHDATCTGMLGDVVLDDPPDPPVVSMANANGFLMIAPLGAGVFRVILIDRETMHFEQSAAISIEDLAASTKRITGTDFSMRNATWLSRYTDESRVASQYRNGPFFLAGDAAHIHMPAGGQGLNVGLQDAMNLGWKLAACVKDVAHQALIDSYEQERHPVAMRLCEDTMAQTALLKAAFTPDGRALRAKLNSMMDIPEFNRRLALGISAFGVRYSDPMLAGGPDESDAIAGERIANRQLTLSDGSETALYKLLEAGRWLHLDLTGSARTQLPDWLEQSQVDFHEATPAQDDALLRGVNAMLIRPDGHCASFL